MLPRWHIVFGALFTLVLWLFFPSINWIYLIAFFLASFLIDFDHYAASVLKTRKLSLKHSFDYHARDGKRIEQEHARGIRTKGDFHLFHTLEFHLFVLALALIHPIFFFIFLGMLFHSICDLIHLTEKDYMYRREFFLTNWLAK